MFATEEGLKVPSMVSINDAVEDEELEEEVEVPITRFKDNENGTVTDPETGLMWTKDANLSADTMLFYHAFDYIEKMNEGEHPNFGYTDWRLPILSELRSLIDYTKFTKQGHILPDGHPFENVKSINLDWGINTYLYTADYSWLVSLYCRLVGHNVELCYGYVWPVRGGERNN